MSDIARVEIGSAMSTAFVFDETLARKGKRHAVVTVHADGSGSITIYDSTRGRQLASVSIYDYEQFRAVREGIDSQAAAADAARLRRAPSKRRASESGRPRP